MTGFGDLAQQTSLYPQEALASVKSTQRNLVIGLPKEVSMQDNRIALTPEAVAILVRNGHQVIVENGAGELAQFSNHDYSEAGAQIVYSAAEVYESTLILKIEPVVAQEFNYLKRGQTIISALNLPARDKSYFECLNDKHITAISYEHLEDSGGGHPVIRSLSEIVGNTVMLIAAEYLSSANKGKGMILGGVTGVPPTKVVIIGAGTVAEYAARAAIGLGADIKIFDTHIYRLQRLRYAIGHNIYTSIIESDTLSQAIERADVVIGALRPEDGHNIYAVTEEMVSKMRPHSVIIDVTIDQGGCIETARMTSHNEPTYYLYDVIHYCVPNIASRVAHTASMTLSNIFLPLLLRTGIVGGIEEMIYTNAGFSKGVYAHSGTLTNAHIAQKFNMKHIDLSLLMAARR